MHPALLLIALIGCQASDAAGSRPDAKDSDPVAFETGSVESAATASSGDTAEGTPAYAGPHNVLLVLVDDISAPKVGHYGESTAVHTPVMDALAADGVWFRNAWAAPSCSPTRAAMQTGRLGRRTGFGSVQQPSDPAYTVPAQEMFLPSLLSQGPHAYGTAMYGKWHLSAAGRPNERGWGTWQGSLANLVGIDGEKASYYGWRKTYDDGHNGSSTDYVTTDTTDDAVQAVQTLAEPWLVHVSYNAAHVPFEPPPPHLHSYPGLTDGSSELDLERAVVEAMDTELGRLLDAIPPDVRARTTVLVVGDNGEIEDIREPGSGPGGKLSVLDGGVRVPFIAQGSAVPARGPSEALVHVVDVVPTVLTLAGVDPHLAQRADGTPVIFDGRSLVPLFRDPSEAVRDTLYTELFGPNGSGRGPEAMTKDYRTVRNADYKLVVDRVEGVEHLYAYTPAHPEQGTDDLLAGTLSAAEQAAFDALHADLAARMHAMENDLPY